MALVKTKYQAEKLAEARAAFPAQWWRAEKLTRKLQISRITLDRWIFEWVKSGVIRREETAVTLNRRGAAQYRYRFV